MKPAHYITALILANDREEAEALLVQHGASQEQAQAVWLYKEHRAYFDAGETASFQNIKRTWDTMLEYVLRYF